MIVTLLTDFGVSSPYVAAMKGVLLSMNPGLTIVDISHAIAPQNVDEAAFVIHQTWPWFPSDTIHVIVVDPGVGSERNILMVSTDQGLFIAPDNTVLKYIFTTFPEAKTYKATHLDYFNPVISNTFHGRDIFAPVAAHSSLGVPIEKMAENTSSFLQGSIPEPVVKENEITGHIIYFDAFGNGMTDIHESLLKNRVIHELRIGEITLSRISRTYSDVAFNAPLALISSSGQLEIAVNGGNARHDYQLDIDTSLHIKLFLK